MMRAKFPTQVEAVRCHAFGREMKITQEAAVWQLFCVPSGTERGKMAASEV